MEPYAGPIAYKALELTRRFEQTKADNRDATQDQLTNALLSSIIPDQVEVQGEGAQADPANRR